MWAGKSSIIQALFRIVEAQSGRVEVCGVDTRRVPLSRLRSVLAIIPQDPVLLRGPIRCAGRHLTSLHCTVESTNHPRHLSLIQ